MSPFSTPRSPLAAALLTSKPVLFGVGLLAAFVVALVLLLVSGPFGETGEVSDEELAALIQAPPTTEPLPNHSYDREGLRDASVDVRTTPEGAFVRVGPELSGVAPLRLDHVRPGYYAVLADHPGYVPLDTSLYLASGASLRLDLTLVARPGRLAEPALNTDESDRLRTELRRAAGGVPPPSSPAANDVRFARADPAMVRRAWTTGSLSITSTPTGARATVNGQPRGTTPLTLPALSPGLYDVSLSFPDHKPERYQVLVGAGAASFVEATLGTHTDR